MCDQQEQEFRFDKPDAQSGALRCECRNWQAQAMTNGSDGVWTTTVSLSPGTYGYKFLVNGTDWVFDPNSPNRKIVNGIENSAIEISEETARSTSMRSGSPSVATPIISSRLINQPAGARLDWLRRHLEKSSPLKFHYQRTACRCGQGRKLTSRPCKSGDRCYVKFRSAKSWPALVIGNTEAYSNIDSMQQFKQAAVDEGW
jgi:hypothetical protein